MTVIVFIVSFQTIASKPAQIPVSSFNQMPVVQQPSVSPNGKNIAVITNRGEVTQVSISPFDKPQEMLPVVELGGEKYRIESINWANDERVLVTVTQPFKVSTLQVRTTHVYSVKIDGSDIIELKKRSRKQTNWDFYRSSPRLLSTLVDEPNHVLMTIRDKRDDYYSSVFKVNITTGDFEKYLANNKKIVGWYFNDKGEVLMAIGIDDNYNTDIDYIYTRKDQKSDWKLIKKIEAYQDDTFSPVMFEPKTNSVIVISDHKLNKKALWRYFIDTQEYKLLGAAPDKLDIRSAITRLEGNGKKVVGYTYVKNFIKKVYFDQSNADLNQQVVNIFAKQGLQAFVYDWDKAENHYILYGVGDNKPGQFYLYNKSKQKISPWYGQYPSLSKHQLASVMPFTFKARDGMDLNGYLTLPNNVDNPSLIVFPHGGPYGVRDSQYFNPFVQLFASRGYAVLQVNYRGSGGFGNAYKTSGYAQWGKKMQTDLMDAVNWVKEMKLANIDNSCIVGASYGGYAALAAGYQTPKQFKCIVSIAGVGDMDDQVIHWKSRGHRSYIDNVVNESDESLAAISPIHHVKKFEAPVLLIHGRVDTRVSYHQSEDMYEALDDAGKEVKLKMFEWGTHNLDDSTNRQKAMGLMIEFVDQYLK
ncbi:MAG: alpha/beta fold hydrolase [Colwellia sp.]|nr:alpha/beta fold hydrolase [Colwellia sp.]